MSEASFAVRPLRRNRVCDFLDRRRGVGHDEAMIVGLAEGNAVQFLVYAHDLIFFIQFTYQFPQRAAADAFIALGILGPAA